MGYAAGCGLCVGSGDIHGGQEHRIGSPGRAYFHSGAGIQRACSLEARGRGGAPQTRARGPRRVLDRSGRPGAHLAHALHRGARRDARTELPLVQRRAAECLLQLPRRAPQHARREDRGHLRGRAGRRAAPHLSRAARASVPLRQRTQGPGRRARRPRHHLHAVGAGDPGRDARLQPHRRRAFGRVRRLLGAGAQGPYRRYRGEGGDHGRWRLARGPRGRAQGGRRPGPYQSRQERQACHRAQANRPAGRHGPEARPLVARRHRGPACGLRAGVGRCGAPALPALHLGLHRQAEGHSARHRRLSARSEAHHAVGVRPAQ